METHDPVVAGAEQYAGARRRHRPEQGDHQKMEQVAAGEVVPHPDGLRTRSLMEPERGQFGPQGLFRLGRVQDEVVAVGADIAEVGDGVGVDGEPAAEGRISLLGPGRVAGVGVGHGQVQVDPGRRLSDVRDGVTDRGVVFVGHTLDGGGHLVGVVAPGVLGDPHDGGVLEHEEGAFGGGGQEKGDDHGEHGTGRVGEGECSVGHGGPVEGPPALGAGGPDHGGQQVRR